MSPRSLFVTGMLRSGTTLVEKLLCNHPRASVLSQPFPHVVLSTMREFHRSRGADGALPLGDLFGDAGYDGAELATWLREHQVSVEELEDALRRGARYSGTLTPTADPAALAATVAPAPLVELLPRLWRASAHREDADVFGAKEVLAEELAPALLDAGVRVALVVRDPRAVVASLNASGGRRWTGDVRPTIQNVRNWRKSVAVALHLAGRDDFATLRYEDLCRSPFAQLDRLTELVELEPFARDAFTDGIAAQDGEPWRSNSSRGEMSFVSTASLDDWTRELPAQAVAYVEATCRPELVRLGYELSTSADERSAALKRYAEPWSIERDDVDPSLSGRDDVLAAERERLALLDDSRALSAGEERAWFLFPGVRARLTQAPSSDPALRL
jgi:hypothetical protein